MPVFVEEAMVRISLETEANSYGDLTDLSMEALGCTHLEHQRHT